MTQNGHPHVRHLSRVKGSFIVAFAIFAALVIVVVTFNVIVSQNPISNVEIGLVLGSLLVLVYTKPTIDEYVSSDTPEEEAAP